MAMLKTALTRSAALLVLSAGLSACDGAADRSEAPQLTTGFTEEVVAEGLSYPWDLAFLPGGDILVTERDGNLRLVRDGELAEAPISGVPEVFFSGQGGLLEVALTPDFPTSNAVILTYSAGDADQNHTAVFKARLEGDALVDGETIFRSSPDRDTDAHFGGRTAFLPDGTMLLTLGDAFAYREQAQVYTNHLALWCA